MSLEYVPTAYQKLGYAGEEMLDCFLKKFGYDGESYPETLFSLWKSACGRNPFNQYATRIRARGVDNCILHPTKGRIYFEIKNFGHKRFGNKNTSKIASKKVLGKEVLGKFKPYLSKKKNCILVMSHEEVIPRFTYPILQNDYGIKIIVYNIQVLPNDSETFKKAISNLYHTELLYIVKP
jgi:hypothetical protein